MKRETQIEEHKTSFQKNTALKSNVEEKDLFEGTDREQSADYSFPHEK